MRHRHNPPPVPPSNTGSNPAPDDASRQWMREQHRIGWHPKGGWCRKFPGDRNRTYFGWVDAGEAARLMHAEETRRERARQGDESAAAKLNNLTVREAVNLYLNHADREHAAGNMSAGQRASYGDELERLVQAVGRDRKLSDLCSPSAPDRTFRPLRAAALSRGLGAAEKHIAQVRRFLDWCSTTRRLMPPPFYADEFKPPSETEKRNARKADRRAKGTATWTPGEVREIIDAARATDVHRYAWVLLMVNGGMGATDLSYLTDADLDWDRQCISTDRSKTLVARVVPLWDVTAEAMRASRAVRAEPRDPAHAGRFFLTPKGRPLVTTGLNAKGNRVTGTDAVRNWFYGVLNPGKHEGKRGRKPLPALPSLKRHRAGGYTLRSVFATLAAGQDETLVAVVMGHKLPGARTAEYYLRGDLLEDVRQVTSHVYARLFSS